MTCSFNGGGVSSSKSNSWSIVPKSAAPAPSDVISPTSWRDITPFDRNCRQIWLNSSPGDYALIPIILLKNDPRPGSTQIAFSLFSCAVSIVASDRRAWSTISCHASSAVCGPFILVDMRRMLEKFLGHVSRLRGRGCRPCGAAVRSHQNDGDVSGPGGSGRCKWSHRTGRLRIVNALKC